MTGKIGRLVAGGALLGLVALTAPAKADMGDGTMFVTFSRSVALPGVELAAGTYVFALADSNANPSIVRVLSRDRRKIYLTAFTLGVSRPAGLRSPITFGEVAHGQAPRIKAWYPDQDRLGRQFMYVD